MSQKRKKKKTSGGSGRKQKKTWQQAIRDMDTISILFFAMGFIGLCFSYYSVFLDWNETIFLFNVAVTAIWIWVFIRSVKKGGFY